MATNYYIKGISDAFGVPIIGLGLSMFTFGAYLNSSNFNLFQICNIQLIQYKDINDDNDDTQ